MSPEEKMPARRGGGREGEIGVEMKRRRRERG
jgi:hypothetical protein